MKYENASEVLPSELLKEIQKYAAGKLLYIPAGDGRRAWGEASGYRNQLQKRNRMIRNKYAHGITVSELADEYFLSLDSIKKIIYSNKRDSQLQYSPTLDSAVFYADAGLLEEWVQSYVQITRIDNGLSDFALEDDLYFGVVRFPLRLIQPIDEQAAHNYAVEENRLNASEDANLQLPLIIQYKTGKFYCVMQQQLLASLRHVKVNAYPTILILKERSEYKKFMKLYGNVLIFVNKA